MKNILNYSNKEFFNYIFPTVDRIQFTPNVNYQTNNIIFCSGLIYGSIGSGKSEVFRSIVEKAVEYYGIDNVNNNLTYNNFRKLIFYGTDDKLINLLMIDDITLQDIDKKTLQMYFSIRHIHKGIFQVNNGYIMSILGVHRFHGVRNAELRTNLDFLIVKTLPTNPYDYSIIRKFIGDKGIEFLTLIEKERLENIDYKKYNIYWLRTREVGLLELPLAKINYVNIL
jgi:hypothetical protein